MIGVYITLVHENISYPWQDPLGTTSGDFTTDINKSGLESLLC